MQVNTLVTTYTEEEGNEVVDCLAQNGNKEACFMTYHHFAGTFRVPLAMFVRNAMIAG